MSSQSSNALPQSVIPIFTTLASYREWRRKVYDDKKSVGFVATMGALHDGHLSLVKRSLAENDLTVVSIFVNPAQFAPHEDLATYPRTLPRDVELLNTVSVPSALDSGRHTPSAIFAPSVPEMYPSGIVLDSTQQRGTFIEVKGYGHQMEGKTRPNFFRGVATVVTKLFNVIEPTRAYFGQKDIQQALLLRRLTRDLLLSHPSWENLRIVPTARDPASSLALSSRNGYLAPHERDLAAPILYAALESGQQAWDAGMSAGQSLSYARALVERKAQELASSANGGEKVDIRLDYIEMNDSDTFDEIAAETTSESWGSTKPVILSGAMWVGKTRLIDNVVLGEASSLGVLSPEHS